MNRIQAIVQVSASRDACEAKGAAGAEWKGRWDDVLAELTADAPSGSGFDNGTQLVEIRRTLESEHRVDRVTFTTAFHHMTEHGVYDGWTEHDVIVRPSFDPCGFDLRVTGRNRDGVKEEIAETFYAWLGETVDINAFREYGSRAAVTRYLADSLLPPPSH